MTGIEWTDQVWNPTTGCDKVSPGCENCYALTMAKRLKGMGQAKYQNDGDPKTSGPGFGLTEHPDALDLPLRWKKPHRIFVNSMSDLFHKDVDPGFIADVFAVMGVANNHTFQVLTKRPQLMAKFLNGGSTRELIDERMTGAVGGYCHCETEDRGWPLPNVWLGTSIESDKYAFRADHLRATPAAVRFLSLEPLLGPLPSLDLTGIDWVVAGGESGPKARPMHPDWVRDIRDRCVATGVPFFFKQWGEFGPLNGMVGATHFVNFDGSHGSWHHSGTVAEPAAWFVRKVGKKKAGRELDGRTWDEMPGAKS